MNPVNLLTKNELNLMRLCSEGLTNQEIALKTGKALPTVKNTMVKIKDKLGAKNSAHAVAIIFRQSFRPD